MSKLSQLELEQVKEAIKNVGYVFSFGKHRGEELSVVMKEDKKYVAWLFWHTKKYDTFQTFDWKIDGSLFALVEKIIYNSPYRIADNGIIYDYDEYCARNSLSILENELMEECFMLSYWD